MIKEDPEVVVHIDSDNPKIDAHSYLKDNDGNGGTPYMDKYVTHEELKHEIDKLDAKLDLSTEKILHHVDIENANMKSNIKSINTTLAFITAIVTPILTAVLLKFFHLN